MRVPREKLYEEVWAEPMTTVAKRYEVSSNYLARICERLNIPRPGRGHWQQCAVGADVESDPLPEVEPGDEIEWARDGSAPAIAPMSSTSRPRKTDADRPCKHPLLVGVRGLFEDVRGGREVTYLVPRKTKLVDVFVTPATLDRALKLASDLFLFLEDHGHRVVLAPPGRGYQRAELNVREGAKPQYDYDHYERGSWQPVSPTTVLVGEIAIGVTIYETMEEVDAVWRNGKRVRYEPPKALPTPRRRAPIVAQEHVSKHWFPTGRVGLHAYAAQGVAWEQTWIEKTAGELSASFDSIAKALTGAGSKIHEAARGARTRTGEATAGVRGAAEAMASRGGGAPAQGRGSRASEAGPGGDLVAAPGARHPCVRRRREGARPRRGARDHEGQQCRRRARLGRGVRRSDRSALVVAARHRADQGEARERAVREVRGDPRPR